MSTTSAAAAVTADAAHDEPAAHGSPAAHDEPAAHGSPAAHDEPAAHGSRAAGLLAGGPRIDGVTFRLSRDLEADLGGMWLVQDAAKLADGEVERTSPESMAAHYRHLARFDRDRDLALAEADGRIVAYCRVEWNDSNDGERWYECVANVDPAWRRRGIGRRLLAWSEARRLEIAAEHAAAGEAPDRERAMTTFTFDGDIGGRVLLEGAGYAAFRRFATMTRPDLAEIQDLPLPDGLEVRPITRDPVLLRQVFEADAEAFRDHFGWTESSDERFAAFVSQPNLDPALWVVAFDGDEIAGGVLNMIHLSPEGERSGWLDPVFTRRPWRRRGLARALIARALVVLREQGLDAANLGVDLANPNQALALYESTGFRLVSSATAYRKPVPAADADADPDAAPAADPEEVTT